MLVVAACSGPDPEAEPRTTVPILTTTTTTDPYAPPPVIDAAYVNRVLAGLDQVVGEALRMVLRERSVTPDVEEYLRAVYADENRLFERQRKVLADDAKEGMADVRPTPGNKVSTVSQLVTVRADCIFARVHRDYSPVVYEPNPELVDQWVGLKPLDRARDPMALNPTPWMYVYDGFRRDHSQPDDPCAAS